MARIQDILLPGPPFRLRREVQAPVVPIGEVDIGVPGLPEHDGAPRRSRRVPSGSPGRRSRGRPPPRRSSQSVLPPTLLTSRHPRSSRATSGAYREKNERPRRPTRAPGPACLSGLLIVERGRSPHKVHRDRVRHRIGDDSLHDAPEDGRPGDGRQKGELASTITDVPQKGGELPPGPSPLRTGCMSRHPRRIDSYCRRAVARSNVRARRKATTVPQATLI